MPWLGPPWFNYWFSFTLAYSRISHEYSSLFIIMIHLIIMFSLWCIDWVVSLYANQILCISVLRVASGPRVKLASCKSALNPRWLILPTVLRLFILCFTLCYFVLFFSPFNIAITSLWEERANLNAFRTFVRFALVWVCLLLLPLVSGKGCGLWLWHSRTFLLPCFCFPL